MLARWDPFEEMDRLTNRVFGEHPWFFGRRSAQPVVDVFETDEAIELCAELPGMRAEDVKIDITDNVLSVSGERKLEKEENREGYRRIERSYGSFERSFTLPHNVDQDHINAELRDGVLRLTVPKREQPKPKRVEIGGGETKAETIETKGREQTARRIEAQV
jgi:HSP20 family protein